MFIGVNLKPLKINGKCKDIIAVHSSKYNGVYRARLIGINSDETSKLKCVLIDFGYVDMIPSENIFVLPSEFSTNRVSVKLKIFSINFF